MVDSRLRKQFEILANKTCPSDLRTQTNKGLIRPKTTDSFILIFQIVTMIVASAKALLCGRGGWLVIPANQQTHHLQDVISSWLS
jgi:hypothetical protein